MSTLTHNTLACFDYFHDLWERLLQQLERRRLAKYRQRNELKRICGAVEAIVEGTDVRLRGVCNYQEQLHKCACSLLYHIEHLVDNMPPAVLVDHSSLFDDPLVHTLLSNFETVQRLLVRNRDIKEYFDSADHATQDEVFALLFVHHREKTILGSELRGDIVLKEVQQTAFDFYGHRLIGPSTTEEDARIEMVITLFEGVLMYIKDQFLQQKKALIYQQADSAAVDLEENINNPEVYIRKLVKQLSSPRHLIRLQEDVVRVSKMGIKLPLDSPVSSDLLRLYELRVADVEPCVATIICYPRDGLSDNVSLKAVGI